MAKFELSIETSYQQEWGIWEAFRELASNAHDAQQLLREYGKGKMEVSYSQANQEITIKTDKVKVPHKALLMGASGSRGFDSAIGKFGEGLPMSLLVLARSTEHNVVIINDDEKWNVDCIYSETYHAEVVRVSTRKVKPRGAFIVTMTGINSQLWTELRDKILWVSGYDKKRTFKAHSGALLLLDTKHKGKIYNKGVFVTERPDAPFGFSLELELNRDRSLPDEWDLRWACSELMDEAVRREPEIYAEDLAASLFEGVSLVSYNSSLYSGNAHIVEAVSDHFADLFGEGVEPVRNNAQAKELAFFGKRAAVVNDTVLRILEKELGDFEKRKQALEFTAKAVHQYTDLDPAERGNYDKAAALLVGKCQQDALDGIEIVTFSLESLLGVCEGSKIRLSRSVLSSLQSTLTTLVHEVAHLGGATDGSVEHTNIQMSLMAQIVEGLL